MAGVDTVDRHDPRTNHLRRAVIASTIGTAIQWYDFFLYSAATGLVFAQLFLPRSSPTAGMIAAFGVYAVGFIARPIGAMIFGHFGDRAGRKSTLIATLFLMGGATFLVGCVPSYEVIGVWGAVALTVLRFLQGVGLGGEWAGSVLLATEWDRQAHRRGLVASLPQLGVPIGLLMVNAATLLSIQFSGDQFLAWGWRIPFWFSIVLVAIGLYIRLSISETPVFRQLAHDDKIERMPAPKVIRQHPREIMLCALAKTAEQVPFYIFTAFVFAYGAATLELPQDLLLSAVLAGAAISIVAVPLFGYISDLVGRKTMYIAGACTMGVFAFVYFALLDSGSHQLAFIAIAVSLVPHSMMYGPQAALFAETFPGHLRYSGASLGYQASSIFAGGPAPLIGAWLLASFGSGTAVAVYIFICAAVSAIACSFLLDRTGKELDA